MRNIQNTRLVCLLFLSFEVRNADFKTSVNFSADKSVYRETKVKFTTPKATTSTIAPTPAVIVDIINDNYKEKGDSKCACVPKHQCGDPGFIGPRNKTFETRPKIISYSSYITSINGETRARSNSKIINLETLQPSCAPDLIFCCLIIPEKDIPFPCGVQKPISLQAYPDTIGQSTFGEHPWSVLLLTESDDFVASGVLIDRLNVLTVAHRVIDFATKPDLFNTKIKVRLGDWDIETTQEPFPYVEIPIAAITIHKHFNQQSLHNDIALIRLERPYKDNFPHIGPICLDPQDAQIIGQKCWVTGYGKNKFNDGKYSGILREVDLKVIDPDFCEECLRKSPYLGSGYVLSRKSFLCAGGEKGKDSCTGDGGSGLVCQRPSGEFFVAGLVSWGLGCGEENSPGVYVNVPNYINWIRENL